MPAAPIPRVRQCGRLDKLSLSALEKFLLRAFYFLAKEGCTSTPEDLLGSGNHSPIITTLCEKDSLSPIEEIRSYLFPKLHMCYRQQLVDDLLIAMGSPEFDENMLVAELEFKFRSCDIVASTSDMNQIIQNYLKCLLLGYVTKLDFSELYAGESCWIARSRRILHTWGQVKGDGSEFTKGIKNNNVNTISVECMWKDLVFENSKAVGRGAIASAPYFRELLSINIDYVATGQLVWSIGCNCPLLQHLSLYLDTRDDRKYSKHFEDNLVDSLAALYGHKKYTPSFYRGRPLGCPKLQTLIMPLVGDHERLEVCTSKLLCYLPRLHAVHNVSTAKTFVALLSDEDFKRKPLSLKYIDESHSEEATTEDICEHFQLDMKFFFPKVTSIKIIQSKQRGGLRIMSYFPKVNNLEVITLELGELEFGSNFTRLTHFKSNCRWDEKKLAGFSQRAPNLEDLTFSPGSLHKHRKSRDSISFPVLKIIRLLNLDHIDPEPFTSLIKGTKVLTHLIIENGDYRIEALHSLTAVINDKTVAAILSSLKKLVVFRASLTKFVGNGRYAMTMKSVNSFLNSCPDLSEIGNLFHWDIPYQDVLALKQQAKDKNWDVNLFPPERL
ncbi:uncharacterized protein [Procambarus clarkii]|uniref:uncharacterized protein n=1 Tax=Procambarus clarkii TaxID=6728 RepID=UPI001E675B2F|nr:uncharacterized protein LOC123767059 [Procambarus clarkii]